MRGVALALALAAGSARAAAPLHVDGAVEKPHAFVLVARARVSGPRPGDAEAAAERARLARELATAGDAEHDAPRLVRACELALDEAERSAAEAAEKQAVDEGTLAIVPPEYGPALTLCAQVGARFPKAAAADQALYLTAWMQGEAGRGDLARAAWARLIADHPDSALVPEAELRLGLAALDAHDDKAARAALRKAADAAHAAPVIARVARFELGMLEVGAGHDAAAVAAFDSMITGDDAAPEHDAALRGEAIEQAAGLVVGGDCAAAAAVARARKLLGGAPRAVHAEIAKAASELAARLACDATAQALAGFAATLAP